MLLVVFFLICFFASIIGAICGIGGGVIIKPVLDAFGVMDVANISFLSGCTVLSMTTYSVIKSKLSGSSNIEQKTGLPLALGAAVGGLLGKWMFSFVSSLSPDKNKVGAVQAACLMLVTVGTLVYTLYKERIKTYHVTNLMACVAIGIFLGILSSFLGIGGGPINLVVLFFFFSMTTIKPIKSLSTVFSSIFLLRALPAIPPPMPPITIKMRVAISKSGTLFVTMVVIIFINIYNIYQFIG